MKNFYFLFFTLFTIVSFGQKNLKTIGFIENKGQIVDQEGKSNPLVHYLLNSNGLNVQLRSNGFSYDIYEAKKVPLRKKDKALFHPDFEKDIKMQDSTIEYKYHRIDIDFLNSNVNVKLLAEEKSTDYDNYYNVASAPQGITDVHKYKKVTYQNIYNHIDVVFFIPKDTTKAVEYNFVVRPGGKASDIQLEFKGAKTELEANKIKMGVRFGQMEETLPSSWEENGGNRKELTIGYKKIKKNVYGFDGDLAISDKTIVIDPTPTRLWGTYYGASDTDYLKKMYSDNLNNLFITGDTTSRNNFATAGSFITTSLVSNVDSYVAKLDSNSNRIWCTYLNSNPSDIKTDTNGNAIVTGMTFSNLLGTAGTFQPSIMYLDGFILKLNTNGVRIWGTYYPGRITGCAVGSNNTIFITGFTTTSTNVATPGTHQQIINGQEDAFVTKFNQNGQRLWGTYYGGNFDDEANDITIDEFNNTYIVGKTVSTGNIGFGASHQMNNNNNSIEGFLAKFNDFGNIVFGTFYGGSLSEFFTSIDYNNNKILISGRSSSQSGISTSNAPFPNPFNLFGNINNGFFSIFSSNGQLLMGSYFQNTITDNQFDTNGNIFICGDSSDSGIGTSNSYQPSPYDLVSDDSYLVKLNPSYSIEWGTYYGGESFETETNIHISNNGNYIYLGGRTDSTNNISSPNSFQPIKNTVREDAFIVKFQDCMSVVESHSNSPICIGQNLQLSASGGTGYAWTGPNGFTSTNQNPVITNANASHSGQYTCVISGTGGCDGPTSVDIVVGDTTAPVANTQNLPVINGDCNTLVSIIPTALDNCAGTINATTTDPLSYSVPGNYTIHWNYNDGNGNTSSQNQNVVITATALPSLTSPQNFCIQQNATLNSISITGQNVQWYDALTNGNLLTSSTALQNGMTYYASQTVNGCESLRIPVTVTIQNTPAPTGFDQSLCATQNPTLSDIIITGSGINWYASATSITALSTTMALVNGTTYYATQTINGCESINRLPVIVTLINTLNATDYAESICDALNDGNEIVNLTAYNTNLISNQSGCTFEYYNSLVGATNQSGNDQITNTTAYSLGLGLKTIYVRITSSNGCHQIVELQLTLVSKPVITISDIMPICEGSSITVDAGTGYDSYLWSTNETSSSIVISTPGNYTVTVDKYHGALKCTSVKNFSVVKSNVATISQVITSDWTDNENTITAILTGGSVGDYVYSLDGITYQSSNTFTGLESGEYTVYVKDKNGCGITSDDFYLLMYPKFFTPNGDGFHDIWQIKFSENEPNLTVKLFDRFGKLLKAIDNKTGWNGTLNNQELPATDYWFVVTRKDGKEYKGHFALKR